MVRIKIAMVEEVWVYAINLIFQGQGGSTYGLCSSAIEAGGCAFNMFWGDSAISLSIPKLVELGCQKTGLCRPFRL